VLILALIFMVVTAIIVTGLAAWAGNDIKNIGNLKAGRSSLFAADGVTQDAIWNVRFSYAPSGSGYCSNTPWGSPFSIDGENIYVTCTTTTNESNAASRVVVFSAYPLSQCTSAGCSGNPFLQAQVTFEDFSNLNRNDCSPAGHQTTCGFGMSLNSWVVQPGLT
jgi:hypothetical protein